MTHYFIVPGLGNSGPEHWQTWFEKNLPNIKRINQRAWDSPICREWIETIDNDIQAYDPGTVVLIGHSLGCSAIVHWVQTYKRIIKGAFLVAPSDPESNGYTFPAIGFAPLPVNKIPFKSVVIASSDDPWVSNERARYFADSWGSEYINIGAAGHINAVSGYGVWESGLKILKDRFE